MYLHSIVKANRYIIQEELRLLEINRMLYGRVQPFTDMGNYTYDLYERCDKMYEELTGNGTLDPAQVRYTSGKTEELLNCWKKIIPRSVFERYTIEIQPVYSWQEKEVQLATLYTNLGSLAANAGQMYRECINVNAHARKSDFGVIQLEAKDLSRQKAQMIFFGSRLHIQDWISVKELHGAEIIEVRKDHIRLHKTTIPAFITLELYNSTDYALYTQTFFL